MFEPFIDWLKKGKSRGVRSGGVGDIEKRLWMNGFPEGEIYLLTSSTGIPSSAAISG
jgi:hypothetical protein